jgi:predicted transcriptional regulator
MKSRQNSQLELLVTKGIIMSHTHGTKPAMDMMIRDRVPNNVIIRVLYQKDRIRHYYSGH